MPEMQVTLVVFVFRVCVVGRLDGRGERRSDGRALVDKVLGQ